MLPLLQPNDQNEQNVCNNLLNKTITIFTHLNCLVLFKTQVFSSVHHSADLVTLAFLVLGLCFPLCCHIFQFRVQFSLQVSFLIGIHGFVFLPTAGVENTFFAYSHPSMRLGFIPTAVNLKIILQQMIRFLERKQKPHTTQ